MDVQAELAPLEYLSVSTTEAGRRWRMIVAGLPVGADTPYRRDVERLWRSYWHNKGRYGDDVRLPHVWDADLDSFVETPTPA